MIKWKFASQHFETGKLTVFKNFINLHETDKGVDFLYPISEWQFVKDSSNLVQPFQRLAGINRLRDETDFLI